MEYLVITTLRWHPYTDDIYTFTSQDDALMMVKKYVAENNYSRVRLYEVKELAI